MRYSEFPALHRCRAVLAADRATAVRVMGTGGEGVNDSRQAMDADPFLISYGITTLELSHARQQLAPADLQARRRQIYTATYRARHKQKLAASRERKRHFAPQTKQVQERTRFVEEMRSGARNRRRAARRQCKHLESRLWRFWSCHVVYRALVGVQ